MAPYSTFVNLVSFFYPFGNTPAVNLAQDLPPESDGRILLLGCGDARNILFTVFANMGTSRSLEFTCCDHETAVVARNVLLLTLILDDVEDKTISSIWNIYYHLYLSESDSNLLNKQAKKLYDLSDVKSKWQDSEYGKTIAFYDDLTLNSVRAAWKTYIVRDLNKEQKTLPKQNLEAHLQKSRDMGKTILGGGGLNITGLRSAAPVGAWALKELPQIHKYFWDHGVLSWDQKVLCATENPNPTICAPLVTTTTLHYGSDPLLGFHLALAYLKVLDDSTLYKTSSLKTGPEAVVLGAQAQLRKWAYSFRCSATRFKVNVMVNDIFTACEMLNGSFAGNLAAPESQTSPKFNVIDTSNLLDHVGSLNLLIAVVPLLENTSEATLYTDILVKQGPDMAKLIPEFLYADFSTMAMLLGLFAPEYWTNASLVSPEEEMMDSIDRMLNRSGDNSKGQAYRRFYWKFAPASKINGVTAALRVDPGPFATFLYEVYRRLFSTDNGENLLQSLMSGKSPSLRKQSYPVHHVGSFAILLDYLRARVRTDWSSVINSLMEKAESNGSLILGGHALQELYLHFHLHGLFTTDVIKEPSTAHQHMPATKSLGGWDHLPGVVCLTLNVPPSALRLITDISPTKLGSPVLKVSIGSSASYKGKPWENCFSVLQLSFGKLSNDNTARSEDFQPKIIVDKRGWFGNSPMLVSFFVPSWILLLQPEEATVALAIHPTLNAMQTFLKKLGPRMAIYETKQGDESTVLISKAAPELVMTEAGGASCLLPRMTNRTPYESGSASHKAEVLVGFNKMSEVETLTSRLVLNEGSSLDALRSKAQVALEQRGPFVLRILIGGPSKDRSLDLQFPMPVAKSRTTTRIARKSGYVELIVNVKGGSTTAQQQDELLAPSYPSFPTMWITPRLLPSVNPTVRLDQDLSWAVTHVSLQMSDAERKLREKHLHSQEPCPSTRVNFKDSLHSMFVQYAGLQGNKTSIFGLTVPEAGGVHIIILVSKLKLDIANHTLFLDVAIVPLLTRRVQALASFLQTITAKGVCQIKMEGTEELALWHRMLPIYAERCRSWSHSAKCEYLDDDFNRPWAKEQDPLCSCGRECFPDEFKVDVPAAQWKVAKRFAVRGAISPLYFVPYIDKIYTADVGDLETTCSACGVKSGKAGASLSACSRCKAVKYCSKECQTRDWKTHKRSCGSA